MYDEIAEDMKSDGKKSHFDLKITEYMNRESIPLVLADVFTRISKAAFCAGYEAGFKYGTDTERKFLLKSKAFSLD